MSHRGGNTNLYLGLGPADWQSCQSFDENTAPKRTLPGLAKTQRESSRPRHPPDRQIKSAGLGCLEPVAAAKAVETIRETMLPRDNARRPRTAQPDAASAGFGLTFESRYPEFAWRMTTEAGHGGGDPRWRGHHSSFPIARTPGDA